MCIHIHIYIYICVYMYIANIVCIYIYRDCNKSSDGWGGGPQGATLALFLSISPKP